MSHHTTKSLQRRFPFSAKNSVGTATPQYLYKADRSPANRIGESPLPYKQIPFTPLDEKKPLPPNTLNDPPGSKDSFSISNEIPNNRLIFDSIVLQKEKVFSKASMFFVPKSKNLYTIYKLNLILL